MAGNAHRVDSESSRRQSCPRFALVVAVAVAVAVPVPVPVPGLGPVPALVSVPEQVSGYSSTLLTK